MVMRLVTSQTPKKSTEFVTHKIKTSKTKQIYNYDDIPKYLIYSSMSKP